MPCGNRATSASSAHPNGGTLCCGACDSLEPASVRAMIQSGAVHPRTNRSDMVDSTPTPVHTAIAPAPDCQAVSLHCATALVGRATAPERDSTQTVSAVTASSSPSVARSPEASCDRSSIHAPYPEVCACSGDGRNPDGALLEAHPATRRAAVTPAPRAARLMDHIAATPEQALHLRLDALVRGRERP